EQHGAFELRSDLAHDVDRLRFELVEVRHGGDGAQCAHEAPSLVETCLAETSWSSSSRARTAAADSAGSRPSVCRRSSGFDGSSYGSETPVKCSISPDRAFA